ncbi:hypothetical protein B0H10DRAFT_2233685 [Mycena sp. CBHHK59/15]|nr:hypothetical protein B0H10DRAFT_2233685 [Mycena sp. CBHHK59/15]
MRAQPKSKTPLEMVTGAKPNLADLCKWGCNAWVKRTKLRKLDEHADQGYFVGYDEESKDAYCIYSPGKRKVIVECDVYFNNDEVLEPVSTWIEGDEVKPATLPTPETPAAPATAEPAKHNTSESLTAHHENHTIPAPAPPAPTQLEPVPTETPAPPPHKKCTRRNGLIEPELNTSRVMRARQGPGFYKNLLRTAGVTEEQALFV